MRSIVLQDENVFLYEGKYPMRVITEGINLTRFKANPVMLWNHNLDKVIGKWTYISMAVKDGRNIIRAIPKFDNDEFSKEIENKYNISNSVQAASIGLDVENVYIDDEGVITISSSTAYEASLTSVGQNENALAETEPFQIKFSRSEGLDELINKLKLSKMTNDGAEIKEIQTEEVSEGGIGETKTDVEIEVSDVLESDISDSSNDTEDVLEDADKDEVEDTMSLSAEKDEAIENLKSEVAELKALIESLKSDKTASEMSRKNLDSELNTVKLELEAVKLSKDALIKDYEAVKAIAETYQANEKLDLINKGVTLGKLNPTAVNLLSGKSLDDVKAFMGMLDMQSPPNLVATLSRKNNEPVRDYGWYLANDKAGIAKMEKENPAQLAQLQAEFVNSVKNK